MIVVFSPSVSRTDTSSGLSTRAFAMSSISALSSSIAAPPGEMRTPRCRLRLGWRRLQLLENTGLPQKVVDRHRRLGPFLEPLHHPLLLDRDGSRRLQWIVRAKDFDVPPVSRHPGIRCHDSIEGPLVPPPSRESESHHVFTSPLSASYDIF